MSPLRNSIAALFGAAAIGALAVPVLAADQVSPITVTQRPPTSLTISVVGKSVPQVKGEIREAASTVCRNAFRNGDLGFYGDDWCTAHAAFRAYDQYQAILKAEPTIVASLTVGAATN